LRAGEPLYNIDAARIQALRPDVLITQAHCEVCAVTPGDVERSGACVLGARQVALTAFSVEDIFASIRQIAEALGLEERGAALVRREQERLENVRAKAANFAAPTAVMLEWTDPVFAMGNWGPELMEIANGRLLIGHKGEYSAAIPGEELRDADPEYLIVAPCGYDLERSLRELSVLEGYSWWSELQAVRKGNVAFADGNLFFNRSGMTVSRTAEIIAEILHGISFGEEAGAHWRKMERHPAMIGGGA
jgi:iron complex transport system substrate-binding protein